MLKVVVKFKEKVLNTFEADKEEITIGRSEENDITIDNLGVSKRHARISRYLDGYSIEDLDSTNGTLLNKKKTSWSRLTNKDTVTIGKHTLEINFPEQPKKNMPDPAEDTIRVSD